MKKVLALMLAFLLVLPVLSACQPDTNLGTTIAPTTTETALLQTDPTQTESSDENKWEHRRYYMWPFVFKGESPYMGLNPDISNCEIDYFYCYNEKTGEVTLVCPEPVLNDSMVKTEEALLFVKESDPTKIFSAPWSDLSQHTVVYQSDGAPIHNFYVSYLFPDIPNAVWVEGNKKLIGYNNTTGKLEVLLEQYYIESAYRNYSLRDGKVTTIYLWFRGKTSEDGPLTEYLYYPDTGELKLDPNRDK